MRDIRKVSRFRPFTYPSILLSDINVLDHNPLHHAAHYLKTAVTLEIPLDEKRRESAIVADHAHGGKEAEKEFWKKHGHAGRHNNDGAVHANKSRSRSGSLRKSFEHAEGHGVVQRVVDRMRPGDGAAREVGSMTG